MEKLERPNGGIDEYDLLNTLVDYNDQAISDRTMEIFTSEGWPPLRCRMAAIVERVAERWGVDDFVESQRRAIVWARWLQSIQGVSR